ncbi:MAG: hypothetical protein WCR97_04280 [Bacilli bacterium]
MSCQTNNLTNIKQTINRNTSYSTDKYEKSLEYHDDFKILWLTDLHFGNPTNPLNNDEIKEYTSSTFNSTINI